ncbi:hypothetical protein L226DRAFT_163901 [Lentinus tigrinus ALCF2SS1-7]|uniref:uncharacterized protein n=1 Tax=Lentinus tigrinus ALCF2SS1-7 TaxID=1328758 RepID=UPI001165EC4B|nr:hypothetical protein L226DRAFT_163901 [Lentinus tigrinus ALCF2SS1-7]
MQYALCLPNAACAGHEAQLPVAEPALLSWNGRLFVHPGCLTFCGDFVELTRSAAVGTLCGVWSGGRRVHCASHSLRLRVLPPDSTSRPCLCDSHPGRSRDRDKRQAAALCMFHGIGRTSESGCVSAAMHYICTYRCYDDDDAIVTKAGGPRPCSLPAAASAADGEEWKHRATLVQVQVPVPAGRTKQGVLGT